MKGAVFCVKLTGDASSLSISNSYFARCSGDNSTTGNGKGGWLYLDLSQVEESEKKNGDDNLLTISDCELLLNSASYGNEVYIVCESPLTMLSKEMINLNSKLIDEESILVGTEDEPESAKSFWDAITPETSNRKS